MAPMAPSEFFCHRCGVRLPCYQHNPVEPDDAAAEHSPRKIAEAS